MKNFSKAWYDALATERFTENWPDEFGPRLPVLPFITLPLPPEMREAFRTHGELHYFQPEESIIEGAVVKGLQLVESGLSARITATLEGQAGPGLMALAAPHRFATGNLNFATRRPQIGQYRAVSKVTTRRIAHLDAERLDWLTDPLNMRMLLSVKESINLSDRMALTISALLPTPMRFASLLIAMAVFFGTVEEGSGGQRVRIPIPGRARHIATVVSVSDVTLEKLIADMRQNAGLERDGDFWIFQSAALQPMHEWMRGTDGNESFYPRPERIEAFLEAAASGGV